MLHTLLTRSLFGYNFSITAVQMKNAEMFERQVYQGQRTIDAATANHRYQLLSSDFTELYRRHNRSNGIDVTVAPEYNIDHWLDPTHKDYKPDMHAAILHYSSRSERGERFKVCISTKEMDEAAWTYVHHSQMILDGTFGVCTTRLLLFIAMGIDSHGKGIPVAMFIFSAPSGNRATHAGYNTEILTELLTSWRDHMGSRDAPFCPKVSITDTDTKERGALINTWPDIKLLLCKFHLRQCWTNRRKQLFPVSQTQSAFWHEHVIGRLQTLEITLVVFLILCSLRS